MSESKYLRLLCSLPMILVALYFLRFFGLIIIILRYCMYKGKNIFKTPIVLLIVGFLLVLPKLVFNILKIFKVKLSVLTSIVDFDFYHKLLKYGRYLLTIGLILLIIVFIIKCILELIRIFEENYKEDIKTTKTVVPQLRTSSPTPVETKVVKDETHLVECPHCGQEIVFSGNFTTCKYCREKVYYKGK